MRKTLLTALLVASSMASSFSANASDSATGRWQTIDDATGKVKSVVEISRAADGTLSGKVLDILHSERGPNPICSECGGTNKDKPIRGMTILWGLKPKGDGWEGGTILDPANGKTYKSKAKLIGANQLGVSGCIAFICREQVWRRE